ncbi:MAG TPA: ABC transporter permease [Vicinamibacterales bacterium]|nr:ABC transporter permease [Vicinamibacterales bacterium]
MSTLLQDLKYSLRLLLKTPGFSLTAILVLALGIGANAAVFTLVNGMLLRPMAGSERPGQLVGVYSHDRTRPNSYRSFSYPSYADVRDRATVFSEVAAFNLTFAGIGEGETTRRSFVAVVTGNYFSTLGVGLMAGRTFSAEEERPDSRAAVAVVSHQYWKSHGSDPGLLGRTIRLNTRPFTVVGIAPAGFTGTSVLVGPEAYVPLGAHDLVENDFMHDRGRTSLGDRRNSSLLVVGRLKPQVAENSVDAPLNALSLELERAFPAENKDQVLSVHRLPRVSISSNPRDEGELLAPFAVLMAMAAIVLLIACLNLANMMLARGTARRKEVAMRLALGGGRGRIVRQLVTEGFVLSLLGGVAGLVVGYWGVRLLVSSILPYSPVPIAFDPTPDIRVALALVLFCGIATIVFSLGPAWKLARTDVVPELKEQAGENPRKARWFGARNLLVGSQIALSLGLLTTAGLFIRGAVKAGEADPGYGYAHQLLASVDTALAGYDEQRGREVYRRLIDRMRSIPGVQSASLASVVAFGGFTEGKTVQRGGASPAAGEDGRAGTGAVYYSVGAEYFRTLGVPVLAGRDFTRAEEQDSTAPRVAIIDEPLARALFPGQNPVGQLVQLAPRDRAAPAQGNGVVTSGPDEAVEAMEVVGVVAGLRHEMFDKAPVAHLYVPFARAFRSGMHLHLHLASGDRAAEAAMLQTVRREIRAVDDRLPVLGLTTMAEFRDTSLLYWIVRAGASLFTVFGAVAMFLAVVGLYAVKAYIVARRSREIGIRMALGSTPRGILGLVLREGLGQTLGGLAAGLLVAVGIGRVVGSMLYEVNPFDPIVFAAAPLVLASAALAACYLPARRAAKVPPTVALRME